MRINGPHIFRWRAMLGEQLHQRPAAQVLLHIEVGQLAKAECAQRRIDDGVPAVAAESAVRPMLIRSAVAREGPEVIDSADAVMLGQLIE